MDWNTPTGKGECVSKQNSSKKGKSATWILDTSAGTIRATLLCDKVPITCQNIIDLTEKGYYDGTRFHRVIKDFMNQGGDPLTKDEAAKGRWGTGGPGYTIKDEFYYADGKVSTEHPSNPRGLLLKHDKPGVFSMANTGRPASGGSQFFLTAVATPHLDGKHSVFGVVADKASLDVALAINKTKVDSSDRPVTHVVIKKATIEWP
ncbi:MAG: peptidylprolyl isomerase [Euryarchaeota archaeon]|nr:peptidylprolyl isomerase [Euryarchaeota archaeon]